MYCDECHQALCWLWSLNELSIYIYCVQCTMSFLFWEENSLRGVQMWWWRWVRWCDAGDRRYMCLSSYVFQACPLLYFTVYICHLTVSHVGSFYSIRYFTICQAYFSYVRIIMLIGCLICRLWWIQLLIDNWCLLFEYIHNLIVSQKELSNLVCFIRVWLLPYLPAYILLNCQPSKVHGS